jgi:acyl-CoA thioesterase
MQAKLTGPTEEEPALFELDEDTALTNLGPGLFAGQVAERWSVGLGPNGGYLAALVLRGVLETALLPDPLTMTVHYLSRPEKGPCRVSVTTLREGRGHGFYRAELTQDEAIRCACLVTMGRLRPAGPSDFQPEAPSVPPPDGLAALGAMGQQMALWQRTERRIAKPEDVFFLRDEPGEAVTGGWTRLADGRPSDHLAIAVFLDCWPPAVFGRTLQADPAGAPTIEYTVHWRNRAATDWCYARFETKTLAGGYVDEHGTLWDEEGVLVAESRQLARYGG